MQTAKWAEIINFFFSLSSFLLVNVPQVIKEVKLVLIATFSSCQNESKRGKAGSESEHADDYDMMTIIVIFTRETDAFLRSDQLKKILL